MTIAENVGMGLRRIPGWDRHRIEDRVEDCLALVELVEMGDRYPAQLSGDNGNGRGWPGQSLHGPSSCCTTNRPQGSIR